MKNNMAMGALFLVIALASGCASNTRGSMGESRHDASLEREGRTHRSAGAEAGLQCAGVALQMLKLGLLGVPLTAGIGVLCVPIAVINEIAPPGERVNDGTGASNFAYPGSNGCADRQCELGPYLTDRSGAPFAYPTTSAFGGCTDGRCGVGSQVGGYREWSNFYPNSYPGYYRR